ncbi:MAG: hypothetical protein AAGK32_03645 [Actinomycetota bacterium]
MTAVASVDYQKLNGLLWRYRPLLDRFEFLLEVQLLVAASGQQGWQHHMAELFAETADAINALDLEREMLLGGSASLSDLADDAPDPWDGILREQHAVMTSLSNRVSDLRRRNEAAIAEGLAGLDALMDALVSATTGESNNAGPSYDQDGRLHQRGGQAILFDGRA